MGAINFFRDHLKSTRYHDCHKLYDVYLAFYTEEGGGMNADKESLAETLCFSILPVFLSNCLKRI